jgi:hypothetical protein
MIDGEPPPATGQIETIDAANEGEAPLQEVAAGQPSPEEAPFGPQPANDNQPPAELPATGNE